MKRSTVILLGLCLLAALLAPVAVYLFGSAVMGPYEGTGGLGGFVGQVYSQAFAGKTSALALMLSPALALLTWWGLARYLRPSKPAAT